jgi:ribose-phosphate pyrophosphokinase
MPVLLFALNATCDFGRRVAGALGMALAPHEEREFDDGEHKARPLVDVCGHDCVVIHSLHGDAQQSGNDKLCRLLFFAGALRDHGAARVIAAVPYLAYARKDRRTKPFDPVTTRTVAQLMEAVGIGALITLEVHNVAALQNAFRIPTVHLEAAELFAPRALALVGDAAAAVVSPDPGGVKRAQLFRETLEARLRRSVGAAYVEKRRSAGVVTGSLLAGDVRGATVLLVDDLISTGGTLQRAAQTCLAAGAARVFAFVAHGLFNTGADAAMSHPALAGIVIADSVPPARLSPAVRERIEVVSAAPLFAQAVARLVGLAEGASGAGQRETLPSPQPSA